jgi:hypothetical protein
LFPPNEKRLLLKKKKLCLKDPNWYRSHLCDCLYIDCSARYVPSKSMAFRFGQWMIPLGEIFYYSPLCVGIVNLKPVVPGMWAFILDLIYLMSQSDNCSGRIQQLTSVLFLFLHIQQCTTFLTV